MKKIIEKARQSAQRNVGDSHPTNPKLVWTEYQPGKFDWRGRKGKDSSSGKPVSSTAPKTVSSATVVAKVRSGKPMDSKQLVQWASKTDEANLLKVANSKNGNGQMRMIAYKELENRGFDMDKVDTSGTLGSLMKMTGKVSSKAPVPTATQSTADIDDDINEDDEVTEKWYLDKKDDRVKKQFNLKTKLGRIKYDRFVFQKKKQESDYESPVEVVQDLNEQYLEFLDNPEQRFMISAGGAGIGKSFGFNKMAELLNMKPFQEGDSAGDGDYDIFEATDVSSGKQLLNILKAHNGKIILFDDTDKVLTRTDCASIMKKATATTGSRIVGDPDDVKQNFEFTGRIIIMTNKDLSTLSESEDTKAIISRAMMVSEIYLTVPETIEAMRHRYQDYEFKQTPRLSDANEDRKERDEIMNLIENNQKDIDPIHFSTRTFQNVLINKRRTDRGNKKRQNSAFAHYIGDKTKDWKKTAVNIITKAADTEFDNLTSEQRVAEQIEKAQKVGRAYDDGVNYEVDDPDTVEKAENLLLSDIESEEIVKSNSNEELLAAENLLFG